MPYKIIDVLKAFSVPGNVDAMQLIYNDLHFLSLNIKNRCKMFNSRCSLKKTEMKTKYNF